MNDVPPSKCGVGFDVFDPFIEMRQKVVERSILPSGGGGAMYVFGSGRHMKYDVMHRLSSEQAQQTARDRVSSCL